MNVIDNFRKPFFPQQTRDGLCFFQIDHEPVAIIVMTGVIVIKLGRAVPFLWRAQRFAIIIRDYIDTVRIRRWNQNQNGVVEN